MPALVPVTVAAPAPALQPSAAPPAVPAQATNRAGVQTHAEIAAAAPNFDLKLAQAEPSAPAPTASEPTTTKSQQASPVQARPAQVKPVQIELAQVQAPQMQPAQIEPSATYRHIAAANVPTVPAYSAPLAHSHAQGAHGGWLIQIGAFDDEGEAKQHLSAAQIKVHEALAAKDPFTERVQKGDKALYRARFAGFDKSTAEAACRALKRSDFECMALKD
jgi:D-alanyl-D-alanine carboxypeptidase